MKILVIRRDSRGDVLVATSVLPGLREKYPDSQIHFLARNGFDELLLGNPHIDKIVHRRSKGYDLEIDLNHHPQWDDWMASVHCRIAGVPFHPPELYLAPDELDVPQYDVAVANDAGWTSRQYTRMRDVLGTLSGNYDIVQVDCGPDLGVRHPELSIREAAAVIAKSKFYFGVDTVFMHIAAALGKPMVLIMGPTGRENQYIPHATVVRKKPFTCLEDPEYTEGINIDPDLVIKAFETRADGFSPSSLFEYTDGYGYPWG